MNQEELLNKIRQIIAALEAERGKLDQNSKAYQQIDKNLRALTSNLNTVSNAVNKQGREFTTAANALDRYFKALESGQTRVRMGQGQRVPLNPVRQATGGAATPPITADALNTAFRNLPGNSRAIAQNAPDLPSNADLANQQKVAEERQRLEEARLRRETARLRRLGERELELYNEQIKEAERQAKELEKQKKKKEAAERRRLKALGESTMTDYENQGKEYKKQTDTRAAQARAEQAKKEAEDVRRLKAIGEQAMRDYDDQGKVFVQQQKEKARLIELGNQAMDEYEKTLVRATQKQQDLAEKERRRIENNKKIGQILPGGNQAQNNLYARARRIDPNFTEETLRNVDIDPSSGISRAKFSYRTDEGVVKSTTFTVDRFGKVLVDTQKRFRSFTSAISRDISEVLKWSIAVAAIYGPMQKFGELMQTMIENETALAEASVTLGNAQKSTNEIFAAATQIAQAVGEETNNVLKAYNLAYRATGNIQDATERFSTANKLLTDSLILSKLAGIEEAQAIDLLSAGLKQAGMDLTQGQDLLNSWIAVTKTANVDLNTLATGFATLGDAAEAAGISHHQLNAILATVAETSNQSGQEVANTARALVAGFQSDQAQAMMRSLGISIENASGQARSFLDLMGQIATLRDQDIISDDQFSKLTLALGGGTRRQAAFATFIENFDKIGDIEKASMAGLEEGSETADALAKRLDTVQTASTRLGNAFQSLAQSVGESGGLLDIFKGFLNILTSITTALSDVTNLVGKAGPTLAAVAGAMLFIKSQGPDFSRQITQQLSGSFINAGLTGKPGLLTQAVFGSVDKTGANGFSQLSNRAGTFAKYAPSALGVGVGVLAPALQNFGQGENAKGVGNIVGGAIAGTVGALLGGPQGAVIGSAIGAAIGESFVNAAQQYASSGEFAKLFTPIYEEQGKTANTPEDARRNREKETFDFINRITGQDQLGGATGAFSTAILNAAGSVSSAFTGQKFQGITSEQNALIRLEQQYQGGRISEADYRKAIEMLRELNIPKAKADEDAREFAVLFGEEMAKAQKAQEDDLLKMLDNREIGAAAYRRGAQNLQGFSVLAGQYYGAFGKESEMKPEDFFQTVATVDARASEESIARLNELVQQIHEADVASQKAGISSEEYNQLLARKASLAKTAATYIKSLNAEILSQANTLPISDFTGISGEDLEKVKALAEQRFREDLAFNVQEGVITEEQKQAIIDSLDDIMLKADEVREKYNKAPVDYLQQALQDLKEQGEIIDKEKGIGFQTFDLKSSEFNKMMEGYQPLLDRLVELGYKPDEENQIPILKDGIVEPMKKDWKVVQLLLQEILKTEQKQLDGMYNLPEGASFWVPAQAKMLEPTGGGDLESLLRRLIGEGATTEKVTTPAGSRAPGIGKMFDPERNGRVEPEPVKPFDYEQNPEARRRGYSTADLAATDRSRPATPQAQAPAPAYDSMSLQSIFFETLADTLIDVLKPTTPMSDATTAIINAIKSLVPQNGLSSGGSSSLSVPTTAASSAGNAGALALQNLSQLFSNISTKLSLQIDNRTTVQLDGRQIALAVKQYLKNDFVRYSGGNANRNLSVI